MAMETFNKKLAIILIGPPGSGKDTQAEFLSHEFGFKEVKTSRIIEDKLKSADPNDPVMNHERELFKSGQLNDRELVQKWATERIEEIGKSGAGLIGNGWPRKISEAEIEISTVEKFYPKEAIKVISIDISEEESVKRNSRRRVCEKNGHPILDTQENQGITVCPEDGSPIIIRGDDSPETIKKRYGIYISDTKPVLDFLNKRGYNIITINGEQSIEEIHRDILDKLW